MYKRSEPLSSFPRRQSQAATKNESSIANSKVPSLYGGSGSSTSNISEGYSSLSTQSNSTTGSSSLKRINMAKEESAIFNFEKATFEFESSELSVSSIKQSSSFASTQKDFHCWFGPSGSVAEKCHKCGVFIKEKFITVEDLVYHPKCFQCAKCGVALGSGSHYEDGGNFYCKKDYLELFSEICTKCGKPLAEEYVHVGEKLYHFKCFTCKVCHTKLDGYMEKDGEFYCDKHYQELFSPRCGKCNKLCKEKFLRTTDGKVFHHACFKCNSCGRRLTKHFISEMKYYCSTACVNKGP